MLRTRFVIAGLVSLAATPIGACSTTASNSTRGFVYATPPAVSIFDGSGHTLPTFHGPTDPGAGGFVITISGEVNAISGYAFPPFDPSATYMVDGWNWKIAERSAAWRRRIASSRNPRRGVPPARPSTSAIRTEW